MARSSSLRCFAVLTAAATLLAAGCSNPQHISVDREAAWLRARTLPAPSETGPTHLPPLLDCAGPEAPLCAAASEPERLELEVLCRELADDPETAFVGHRCLAHLALERAASVVVRTTRSADASAVPAVLDGAALEARALALSLDHLRRALDHLEPAARLAAQLETLQRHRLAHALTLAVHADDPALARDGHEIALDAVRQLARAGHGLEPVRQAARTLILEAQPGAAGALLEAALGERPQALALAGDLGALRLAEGRLDLARALLEPASHAPDADVSTLAAALELALVDGRLDVARALAARALEQDAVSAATHEPLVAVATLLALEAEHDEALAATLARSPAADAAALALELAASRPAVALALALVLEGREPLRVEPVLARHEALLRGYGLPAEGAAALVALLERVEQSGGSPPDATVDQVRLLTADALLTAADPAAARAVLARVESQSEPAFHYLQGRALAALGEYDGARAAFEAVLAEPDEAGPLLEAARRELARLAPR